MPAFHPTGWLLSKAIDSDLIFHPFHQIGYRYHRTTHNHSSASEVFDSKDRPFHQMG